MKLILKLEELAQFALSFLAFLYFGGVWYAFFIFLLAPDLGMVGYLINTKVGAVVYNLVHHKTTAILLFLLGFIGGSQLFTLMGIIMFAHSSVDRALGYGLKYSDAFKHTHLGWIGK